MNAPGAIFYGQDRHARLALGLVGEDSVNADVFVAARGFSESVIPGGDDGALAVVGPAAQAREFLSRELFDPRGRRELWHQYTLAADLQSYVTQLIYNGQVFVHLDFLQHPDTGLWHLASTTWLAPETMLHRPRQGAFEQFASRQAMNDPSYFFEGEPPRHFLSSIPEENVLHLRWPLESPGPVPARAVLEFGRRGQRAMLRSLLAARSQAEPEETFITLARGRAGAYRETVEQQRVASARIKDMLFYPGAQEAEIWPWAPELPDYFMADRILRSRIAICQVRSYLLDEFNRQLVIPWSERNGWPAACLVLRPDHFTEQEWRAMRSDLEDGKLDLADVKAAVQAEWECARESDS